jgi:hypothetical protein
MGHQRCDSFMNTVTAGLDMSICWIGRMKALTPWCLHLIHCLVVAVHVSGCTNSSCYRDPGVTCFNLPNGNFSCDVCPPGLGGDGIHCTEIDSCTPNPCFTDVACTDLKAPLNGFTCGPCPVGTNGTDGINCTDVDSCLPKPCYPGVNCTDLKYPQNNFQCGTCPNGMVGNGINCTDIDSCTPNLCYPGVVCTDWKSPLNGYTCGSCPKGMHGDGTSCNITTSCDSNPCALGLNCSNVVGLGYECVCVNPSQCTPLPPSCADLRLAMNAIASTPLHAPHHPLAQITLVQQDINV